jgi:hypothetical protein
VDQSQDMRYAIKYFNLKNDWPRQDSNHGPLGGMTSMLTNNTTLLPSIFIAAFINNNYLDIF